MFRNEHPSGQYQLQRCLTATVACLTITGVALATETVIPKNTVIPVQLEQALSSKNAKVGETFVTYCPGPDCGGFPTRTVFVGTVTHVTHKTDKAPGKLEVKFLEAILPDGSTKVAIEASVAPPESAPPASKQGKQGRGRGVAGAMIGAAVSRGDNRAGAIVGTFVGVASGAAKDAKANAPKDVEIPAATKFRIMLSKPVTLGAEKPTPVPPPT